MQRLGQKECEGQGRATDQVMESPLAHYHGPLNQKHIRMATGICCLLALKHAFFHGEITGEG
jgi:hypothetical protein